MNQQVSVIVSKCTSDGSIYGERLFDVVYSSFNQAYDVANKQRAEGCSVLIRPHYNEKDEKGAYFREWRSFNNQPFNEVRFDLPYWDGDVLVP